MKKSFSKKWKASRQPRKQRKFVAKAPIHIKKKLLSVNLAKPLRRTQEKRNVIIRKGDKIKVMRGNFKDKEGKVSKVLIKQQKIYVEGLQRTKQDGAKVNVPFKSSNLQIIELNLEDKKRLKKPDKKEEKTKQKEIKK